MIQEVERAKREAVSAEREAVSAKGSAEAGTVLLHSQETLSVHSIGLYPGSPNF